MTAAAGGVTGFTISPAGVRGRLTRLGGTADDILAAHDYPPPVARLLAEALALAALLGSLLAGEGGELTLQVHGDDAPLSLLVADWRDGALRAYAATGRGLPPEGSLPETSIPETSLAALFGAGRMVLTVDRESTPGERRRYQGIVPLDAPTLAEAASGYFAASEQVPTLVRLAAHHVGGRWQAGGLLVQQLPEGPADRDAFATIAALAGSAGDDELEDTSLAAETLLWRLFHQQQVRVFHEAPPRRGCRCTADHIEEALGRFSGEERRLMRNDEGKIAVDCEFCARQFIFDL